MGTRAEEARMAGSVELGAETGHCFDCSAGQVARCCWCGCSPMRLAPLAGHGPHGTVVNHGMRPADEACSGRAVVRWGKQVREILAGMESEGGEGSGGGTSWLKGEEHAPGHYAIGFDRPFLSAGYEVRVVAGVATVNRRAEAAMREARAMRARAEAAEARRAEVKEAEKATRWSRAVEQIVAALRARGDGG